MNKRIFMLSALIVLIGLAVFVYAQNESEQYLTCWRLTEDNECISGPCPISCDILPNCFYSLEDCKSKICKDSDGGKNYYEKGYITTGYRHIDAEDTCISEKILKEYYCDNGEISSVNYTCSNGCKNGECIKVEEIEEEVKCIFKNSEGEQECYSAGAGESRFSCKGKKTCVVEVKGQKGEKITWKSSCGGYAYTKIDGINDYAEFNCSSGEADEVEIKNKGFSYAYWQCYDGAEEKQGSETSCKSFEVWRIYGEEFCEGHCYEDGSKCGVNTFSVSKECYLTEEKNESNECVENYGFCISAFEECPSQSVGASFSCGNRHQRCCVPLLVEEEPEKVEEVKEKEIKLVCKDSCPLDNKCYLFGYRKKGQYCSDNGVFETQLEEGKTCENNFECKSNVCVGGKCISGNLIQRIIEWFKRLFGFG